MKRRSKHRADVSDSGLLVPLPVFADLTGQATVLIELASLAVIHISAKALELVQLSSQSCKVPADLSDLFDLDDELADRLHLAMSMSGPLVFGLRLRGGGERIAAKAQRLELPEGRSCLLVSLQQEPELARRFRSLSERMLALDEEIERRRDAERSLLSASAALRRLLSVVRQLSDIVTSEGEYAELATDAVACCWGAKGAVMIARSGDHFLCSALFGAAFGTLSQGTLLDLKAGALQENWLCDPAKRDEMIFEALERAGSGVLCRPRLCVVPMTVMNKPEGAFVAVFERESIVAEITDFEIGLMGQALSGLMVRAEMEARLHHSQKLEAIGRLTGGIAHDFNNLLAVILGNAELLLGDDLEDPKELASEIESSALRGAHLTSQLLSFGRKQSLRPERTDVNQLAQGMLPMIRRTLGENIDLRLTIFDQLWPAFIDRQQLEMALLNLAINARDAMPEGGKLTLETTNAWLGQEYAQANEDVRPGPYVMIGVSDTGIGMDVVTAEQAFAPFFTTKEVGKGSGLGLSMVYGFTKQSGGHVKIYSEVGQGTTVRIYLPRDRRHPGFTDQPEDEMSDAHVPGVGRILLIEDEQAVLKYTERVLVALGYSVDVCQTGSDAIALLDQNAYDLVLTDVVLPGPIDGSAIARHAKAVDPDLPVLFMSGYPESAINHQGRLAPDAELISKPFTRGQLASKLKKLMTG